MTLLWHQNLASDFVVRRRLQHQIWLMKIILEFYSVQLVYANKFNFFQFEEKSDLELMLAAAVELANFIEASGC